MTNEHQSVVVNQYNEPSMGKSLIWKVFFILLGITVVEFMIALAVPNAILPHALKNFLYIALTLIKAIYIVAYFMHLKFEKAGLIIAIILPTIFIVYFIALMLIEGNYILSLLHS